MPCSLPELPHDLEVSKEGEMNDVLVIFPSRHRTPFRQYTGFGMMSPYSIPKATKCVVGITSGGMRMKSRALTNVQQNTYTELAVTYCASAPTAHLATTVALIAI